MCCTHTGEAALPGVCVCTPTCLYLCPKYGQPAVADSCVCRTVSVYVRARAHFMLQQLCVLCLSVWLRAAVLSQVMILGAGRQAGRRPQRRLLRSEGSRLAGSCRVGQCQDCGPRQTPLTPIAIPAALHSPGKPGCIVLPICGANSILRFLVDEGAMVWFCLYLCF